MLRPDRVAEALERLLAAYDYFDSIAIETNEACVRGREIMGLVVPPCAEYDQLLRTFDALDRRRLEAANRRIEAEQDLAAALTEGLPVH